MPFPVSGLALPAATGFFATIGDWAAEYGYLAIFLVVAGDGIFPILPGETSIIAGAVFAAQGDLTLWGVIVAGIVGAVVGDSISYWIGRAGGTWIRGAVTRVAGEHRTRAAEGMVRRQGAALVFTGRFLPGIRIGINMACGAGGMTYPKFLLYDTAGGIVWALQAGLIGYFAGRAFADQVWVALAVAIGVAIAVGTVVIFRERRMVAREEAIEAAEARAEAVASGERLSAGAPTGSLTGDSPAPTAKDPS